MIRISRHMTNYAQGLSAYSLSSTAQGLSAYPDQKCWTRRDRKGCCKSKYSSNLLQNTTILELQLHLLIWRLFHHSIMMILKGSSTKRYETILVETWTLRNSTLLFTIVHTSSSHSLISNKFLFPLQVETVGDFTVTIQVSHLFIISFKMFINLL